MPFLLLDCKRFAAKLTAGARARASRGGAKSTDSALTSAFLKAGESLKGRKVSAARVAHGVQVFAGGLALGYFLDEVGDPLDAEGLGDHPVGPHGVPLLVADLVAPARDDGERHLGVALAHGARQLPAAHP